MGRAFADKEIAEITQRWPIKIVADGGGQAVLQVDKGDGTLGTFLPQEIA